MARRVVRHRWLAGLPPSDQAAPERRFPRATREVLSLALETAREGFQSLRQAGHAVEPSALQRILAVLFRLRGLRHLWELVHEVYPATTNDVVQTT